MKLLGLRVAGTMLILGLGPAAAESAEASRVRLSARPLGFEPNVGQTDPRVSFLSRGSGYSLFLAPDEAVLRLESVTAEKCGGRRERSGAARSDVLRIKLQGASRSVRLEGESELPGKSNYFRGNDPSKWRTEITQYAKVRYRDVWPGIDIVYYGAGGQLEYDFVLKPGADPGAIRLQFEGAERLTFDRNGDLRLATSSGDLIQHRPSVYQESPQGRCKVEGRYVRRGKREVSFRLGAYDESKPVVVDPVLSWSTYLGGTGDEFGYAVTADAAGNVYLTGGTTSADFPTQGSLYGYSGSYDAFVTKISADGAALVYSSYFGDTSDEWGQSIAVDASGNAYVTGETSSLNFPTVNPIQGTCGCANFAFDAFVTKFNATGDAIVYSTFLGGSAYDEGDGIAVDASGNALVTGWVESADFPTQNAIQPVYGGGDNDAFLTKINAAGSAFVYSTYLGGSGDDVGLAVAADALGNAVVVGAAASNDFPTRDPIQASNAGGRDAFLSCVAADGSVLLYSTYLGGAADDSGRAVVLDRDANAYLLGSTSSSDFPTRNPVQSSNAGGIDVFLAKVDATGSALVYATYFGGSGNEGGNIVTPRSIAVDGTGDLYFGFGTQSPNLPAVNAVQSALSGPADAYLGVLDPTGHTLLFGTYLGGTLGDGGAGVAIDATGRLIATGGTGSTDFPTQNPIQASNAGGGGELWVARIAGPLVLSMSPASGPASGGTAVTVSGVDLDQAATVAIGGFPAAPLQGITAPGVAGATTPALKPGGLYDVTVTNPDTNAATLFQGWFADFSDVPMSDPFHCFVMRLFRSGITAGCSGGNYCRDNPVTRAQMAVFLLKGKRGSTYAPPACTGIFPDVACAPAPAFAVDWIEQLSNEGITGGCGGGNFCPDNAVTRQQMAVFLLKAEHGSTYAPPTCTGLFGDVACPSQYADWIEQLYKEGITGGCQASPLLYCPGNSVTRGQMAVFLTKTFGLLGDCGDVYQLRLYNIDDLLQARLTNSRSSGLLILQGTYDQDTGLVDITPLLAAGANTIDLTLTNNVGGWTYGYQFVKNGQVLEEGSCGTVGVVGCNDDGTVGVVYQHSVVFAVP